MNFKELKDELSKIDNGYKYSIIEKEGIGYFTHDIIAKPTTKSYKANPCNDLIYLVASFTINNDRVKILGVEHTKAIKSLLDFIDTPIEDRICHYFILEHKFLKTKGGSPSYLAIRQRPNISYPILQGSPIDIADYKVVFTEREIKDFDFNKGFSMDEFKKIEVDKD